MSSAAVPGATIHGSSVRPPTAGSPPAAGTAAWASGWGGRLSLESLALYLWGPGPKPTDRRQLRPPSQRTRRGIRISHFSARWRVINRDHWEQGGAARPVQCGIASNYILTVNFHQLS